MLEPRNYLEVLYLLPRFDIYRNSGRLEAYVPEDFIGYCSLLCKGAYKASAMVVFGLCLNRQKVTDSPHTPNAPVTCVFSFSAPLRM